MLLFILLGLSLSTQLNLPDIHFKCWARYFVPPQTQFEKNSLFVAFDPRSDKYGTFEIPSEESFFFLISNESIYILNSRNNQQVKIVEELHHI